MLMKQSARLAAEAAGLSADWKCGGQIQYRFEGIRPLGGSVGARVTSNSLRLTLVSTEVAHPLKPEWPIEMRGD